MKRLLSRTKRYGIALKKLNPRFTNGRWSGNFSDDLDCMLKKSDNGGRIYGIELLSVNRAIAINKWSPEFPHMVVADRIDLKAYERFFPSYKAARNYFGGIDFKALNASNPYNLDIFMAGKIAEFKNRKDKDYIFFVK